MLARNDWNLGKINMNPAFTSTTQIINPETALKMLNSYPYRRQRHLNKELVQFYARQMKSGEFLPYSSIEIAYVDEDGKLQGHLINGQHRLRAVIEADVFLPIRIEKVMCQNMAEVDQRYGMTDIGARRNINDHVRAAGLGEEFELSRNELRVLGAATTFIHNKFVRQSKYEMTPMDRISGLREYVEEARTFFGLISGNPNVIEKLFYRSSTMSVALVTLRYSTAVYGEDKIRQFWKGAAEDDGLRANDPRKVMYRHLLGLSLRGSKPPAYSARYVANCFNAWILDNNIRHAVVSDPYGPIKIAGSPWTGEK